MKKFISVFNFTILVLLILSIPLLDKAKADWNSHEFSRIRVSTATGLDSLPSEKATSSGTSINYTINAFGIGHTTSTLSIADSDDVKIKKSSSVLDLFVMTVYKVLLFRQGMVGYSLINGIIPAMTQQQILLKEEVDFLM